MSQDQGAERRFLLLKKRLDVLHYCQPLTIESSALVEKLLNDLVKTTEGFQQIKKQMEEVKIQCAKNEQLQGPLKKENARLVNENNQLHLSMMQIKEDCEFKNNKWQAQVRMLEGERTDWKFMVSQKSIQEKKLQEELLSLKSKSEFNDKRGKGIENQDGNKQSSNGDFELKALKEEQRKWFDRVQEAQQQVLDMKEQVRNAESAQVLIDQKAKHLEMQVENRDKEISRLKSKIDLGQGNLEKLANDYQLQEQVQKCQRLTTQIDLITKETNRLSDENEILKREVSRRPKSPAKAKQEKKEAKQQSQTQVFELEKQLREREYNLQTLQNQYDEQLQELENQRKQIESLFLQNDELTIKAQKADQVIQAYQSDKMAFNRVVDNIKSQKDNQEEQVDSYKKQIQEFIKRQGELEERGNVLTNQISQCQRERDIIERQHRKVVDDLAIERDNTQRVRDQLRQCEREYDIQESKIKDLNGQIKAMDDQYGTMRGWQVKVEGVENEKSRLENEYQLLLKELERVKDEEKKTQQERDRFVSELRKKDTQLLNANKQIDLLVSQKDELIKELKEVRNDQVRLQDSSQRNVEAAKTRLDSEYQTLVKELEKARDEERKFLIERERLQNDLKKKEGLVMNGSKQVELMTRQKEDLMREIKDLRNELVKVKSLENDTKNLTIKQNEKLNSQETAIQEFKELLQREQSRCGKIQQELTEQRQQTIRSEGRCEELESQVKQLRTLGEGLERSREELLQKLQHKYNERLDEERQFNVLRQEKQQLEDKLKHNEQELLASRYALKQVDQERDEMQTALDIKTEELVQHIRRSQKLEEEYERQQSKLVETQSRGERGFETVAQLEDKVREGQFRQQKLINEIENLKYTLQVKEKDLSDVSQDIQILARENQNLNSQLIRTAQEKELQQQQSGYSQQSEMKIREQLRLTEMELKDLSQNYNEVCTDNQRLQVSMQQISYKYQELIQHCQDLEKNKDYFNQSIQGASRKEDQLLKQIDALDRDLQISNHRQEELERQLREAQRLQDQLARENNSQRRVTQEHLNTQEDLTRQMSSLDHNRQILHDQILGLKRELELRDQQLNLERRKMNEVEILLLNEREGQMRTNEQVQQLKNQNEALLTELENMQMRGQRINNQSSQNIAYFQGERQDFGALSRVTGDSIRKPSHSDYQNIDLSREKEENSKLDSSTGWDRLRQESENFKKSLTQVAVSSQYLKNKMRNLAKEYEGVLPPSHQQYNYK